MCLSYPVWQAQELDFQASFLSGIWYHLSRLGLRWFWFSQGSLFPILLNYTFGSKISKKSENPGFITRRPFHIKLSTDLPPDVRLWKISVAYVTRSVNSTKGFAHAARYCAIHLFPARFQRQVPLIGASVLAVKTKSVLKSEHTCLISMIIKFFRVLRSSKPLNLRIAIYYRSWA